MTSEHMNFKIQKLALNLEFKRHACIIKYICAGQETQNVTVRGKIHFRLSPFRNELVKGVQGINWKHQETCVRPFLVFALDL